MSTPVAANNAKPAVDYEALKSAMENQPDPTATLTDGQPGIGGIIINGKPARPFAYFDFRLMQRLEALDTVDQTDLIMIIAFAMTFVSEADIGKLFVLALDTKALQAAMVLWSITVPIAQLGTIAESVGAAINEYVDSTGGGDAEDGEAGETAPGALETSAEGK